MVAVVVVVEKGRLGKETREGEGSHQIRRERYDTVKLWTRENGCDVAPVFVISVLVLESY